MILFPELIPLIPIAGGAHLHIKVTPKASKQRYGGIYEYNALLVLKVFVTAAPEKGKANEAVLRALSDDLDIPLDRLKLVQGHTTSLKKIFIEGSWEEIVQSVQNIL